MAGLTKEKLVQVFSTFDENGDGTINRMELEHIFKRLNHSITRDELTLVMNGADKNQDGAIDYREFVEWMFRMDSAGDGFTRQAEKVAADMRMDKAVHESPLELAIGILYVGKIVVWDLQSGQPVFDFGWLDERERYLLEHTQSFAELDKKPHLGNINCLDVCWVSRQLITGAYDHTLKLWDFSGHVLRTYHGCISEVLCVAVDWPNKRFISGGLASQLKIWDMDKSRPLDTFQCAAGGVNCLDVSWEKSLVICGAGAQVQMWSSAATTIDHGTGMQRPQALRTLVGHTGQVNGVVADWELMQAVTGSADTTMRRWDLEAGTLLQTFAGDGGQVLCLVGDARSQYVASGDSEGVLRIWKKSSNECVHRLTGHHDGISSISSAGKDFVVTGGRDGTVRSWSLCNAACVSICDADDRFGGVWITGLRAQYAQ